jgi:eukaryotic-like serine/threonine-protein kinase
MVMGTPAFTAPERIRGWPTAPASDFWSLGATLHAAVQGRGPFTERGGPMTTMNAVIHEETPAAPAAGQLGPVIAALMDRNPAARPDAAAAARMLADAGAVAPEPAGGPWVLDVSRPGSRAAGQPQVAGSSWAVPRPRAADALPAPASWPTDQAPAAASWPAVQAPAAQAAWPAAQAPAAQAAWPMSAPTMADSARTAGQVDQAWWPANEPVPAAAGYPPLDGMLYSAPVTQTGPADPPVAGPAAPPAAGVRQAGEPQWAGTRTGRHRRRAVLVVCAAATVVAAGVLGGLAIVRYTGSPATGTGISLGRPGAGHATSPASARAHASAPAQTALPAGYSWYTLPAAEAGTDAGFRTAVPAGWKTARNGLVTYLRNPSGSGFVEVDLTRHAKAGNLAQARWLQLESIRQDRFPGYRRISLRPATVLGSPGAVWTFSWTERGVGRVIAQDYLFTSAARGGSTQSYAVFGSAPAADWPQTAKALREVISTFQPLS